MQTMQTAHGAAPAAELAAACPVCGWDVSESGQDVRVGDATARVCGDDCARILALEPTRYLPRR